MRLIDADALIPMMKYATTDNEIGVFPIKIGFDAIVKVINDSPAIEPERKTERWIRHEIGHKNIPWGFDCSGCGEWFVIDRKYIHRYKYCPNCGARMERSEE